MAPIFITILDDIQHFGINTSIVIPIVCVCVFNMFELLIHLFSNSSLSSTVI